eukprot:TRINITY_DN5481_c0_g1_i1.p1 TRINITY_DN5481_c0_g1~~TRINITY_DN5481_c0_g1_i1.p1  ORF type:complete len:577 (+),score=70.41 TRINITY_DN5481_c0_g1_i1:329-2059(+)
MASVARNRAGEEKCLLRDVQRAVLLQQSRLMSEIDDRTGLPAWISDSKATACFRCSLDFKMTRRRHHCRLCGGVFCNNCSSHVLHLEALNLAGAQRVCQSCFVIATRFRSERGLSSEGAGDGAAPGREFSQRPASSLSQISGSAAVGGDSLTEDNLLSIDELIDANYESRTGHTVAPRTPAAAKGSSHVQIGDLDHRTTRILAQGDRSRAKRNTRKRHAIAFTAVAAPLVPASCGTHSSPFGLLSDVLLMRILLLLPPEDIFRGVGRSCRRFYTISCDNQFWRGLYCFRWAVPAYRGSDVGAVTDFSWRQLYIEKQLQEKRAVEMANTGKRVEGRPRTLDLGKSKGVVRALDRSLGASIGAASDEAVKIVLLGESTCGKTSLTRRFGMSEFDFAEKRSSGVYTVSRTMCLHDETDLLRLDLWDVTGDRRFRALTSMYYSCADVIVLVYDVNTPSTFIALASMLGEVRRQLKTLPPLYALVGTKADVHANNKKNSKEQKSHPVSTGLGVGGLARGPSGGAALSNEPAAPARISEKTALEFAQRNNISIFFEVSAATGEGVEDLFRCIARSHLKAVAV